MKIGFIDSGIGGMPYLKHAYTHLKGHEFLYLVDNKNFPYGNKTELLPSIVEENIRQMIKRGVSLVVIACNTATIYTQAHLEKTFPQIPFFGVRPVFSLAEKNSPKKNIFGIATEGTCASEWVQSEIKRCREGGFQCDLTPQQPLVSFVENQFPSASDDEIAEAIASALKECRERSADTFILGCTHYTHLDTVFQKALGSGVSVLDSRELALEYLKKHLEGSSVKNQQSTPEFFVTSETVNIPLYQEWCQRFDWTFSGIL